MSSLAWYPFYPGDYARDTQDLSCLEHGCYRLLLDAFWSRGPLPDDLNRLCRLAAGCDAQTVRFILENYWVMIESGWVNPRLEQIRAKHTEGHARRVAAGAAGGRAKASNAKAMLKQCSSNQNQNQNQDSSSAYAPEEEGVAKATPCRANSTKHAKKVRDEDIESVLAYLNARAGTNYALRNNAGKKTRNADLVAARIAEHGVQQLIGVVDAKAEEWTSDKMRAYLRPATLFAREKCEQYIGQLGTRSALGDFLDGETNTVLQAQWRREQ